MMARVINCHQNRPAPVPRQERRRAPSNSRSGYGAAVVTALMLVPLAGAAEPPLGWTAAGLAAVTVLILAAGAGSRVPWGWLASITGLAGIVVPRGPYGVLGPMLLVTCVLCGVLWFAGRRGRERGWQRPPIGSREYQKQRLAGLSGELRVGQFLAQALPNEFTIVNGLKLPRGAGDIDHLIIGRTGVWLLETKTMVGLIECEPDGTWRRTRVGRAGTPYSAFIGDPAAQVQRNIRAVRDCLRRRSPEALARTSVWIEGLVVFPHPRTELYAEHSRVAAVRLEEAPTFILANTPRAELTPADVDALVCALLEEVRVDRAQFVATAQSAQAMVEVALALPLVLALLFGTLALSRVIQAQTAVVAIAHEAARAGALGMSAQDAAQRMLTRVQLVAPGFGMDPGAVALEWDVTRFDADPGRVTAVVRYTLEPSNLPLVSAMPPTTVRAEHVEFVDPFRSGLARASRAGP